MKVALVGNPNSGKTTLFNALTGANQKVGNWPGVTVEKKEGRYRKNHQFEIIDLPGIYSLSPYTMEEVIARNYLLDNSVDVIVNIIDGSNLQRNLLLTTQLNELGLPIVYAINMIDVVNKRKDKIDGNQLEKIFGSKVICISAANNEGIDQLMDTVGSLKGIKNNRLKFNSPIEDAIESITLMLPSSPFSRFYALHLLENDSKIIDKLNVEEATLIKVKELRNKIETETDDDIESLITYERYQHIQSIIDKVYQTSTQGKLSLSDKIDAFVTNRILALPIFALIMTFVYYISVTTIGTQFTDWTNDVLFVEIIPPLVENLLSSMHVATWLHSLILDGIVAGVGAVIGFVPQIFVLFLCLAILEECGYMSRIAFIMDRIFRKFGLSGKSFIPMLIGTGCSVPGIMASRTIENENDCHMTIITTSFIPCSAKLPIIALIAGAFFPNSWWVAPSAYFLGVVSVIISGIILKKTRFFAGDTAGFVMEMPSYHLPRVYTVVKSAFDRALAFIKKAGSIIFLSTIVIWFITTFGFVNGSFTMLDALQLDHSIAASMGRFIAPIFAPLGFGNWQATVASISGLVAKENLVATMGIIYGMEEVAEDGMEIWQTLSMQYTSLAAYSLLAFNLLCAPCFAAVGAIKREMGNKIWTLGAVGYQCCYAYFIAFEIYQIGSFIQNYQFTLGTLLAIVGLIVMIYLLVRKPYLRKETICSQPSLFH